MSSFLNLKTAVCTGVGALLGGFAVSRASKLMTEQNPAEKSPPEVSIQPSSELLIQAVKTGNVGIAQNVFESFRNDAEKDAALKHRCCHYGTPLGEAVYRGDIPMTRLILSHMTDEQAVAGNQCSTIAAGYGTEDRIYEERNRGYRDINAAVIALKNCDSKWRSHSSYPCEEMLDLLRQRDCFAILREKQGVERDQEEASDTPTEKHVEELAVLGKGRPL